MNVAYQRVWRVTGQPFDHRQVMSAACSQIHHSQWHRNLTNVNSKSFLYKDIKQHHKFENYLVNLPRCCYVPILKLRSCNHRLPMEGGWYSNIPKELWYCDLCDENIIGDDYHFVHRSMCNIEIRIYQNFINRPSTLKFVTLMKNVTESHKLATAV